MRRAGAAAAHPLLLFNNGLGDHVLAMPALRALAAAFDGRATLLCSQNAPRFLFEELPLRRVLAIAFRREGGTRHFDAAAAATASGACDLLVSLAPWKSGSLDALAAALPGAVSIGLAGAFDVRVPRDPAAHMAEVLFRVAQAVVPAAELGQFASALALPAWARAEAAAIRRRIAGGRRLLAVHAQSGEGKSWPAERLAAVLARFLDAHPEFSACLVGTSPHGGAFDRRLAACLDLPLATAFALVGAADLFLGVDSCMLHVADLGRVPGVAIFGPTDPATWGWRFARGVALRGRGATAGVSAAEVERALEQVLAASLCREPA